METWENQINTRRPLQPGRTETIVDAPTGALEQPDSGRETAADRTPERVGMISTGGIPTRRRTELEGRLRDIEDDSQHTDPFNQDLIEALLEEKTQLVEQVQTLDAVRRASPAKRRPPVGCLKRHTREDAVARKRGTGKRPHVDLWQSHRIAFLTVLGSTRKCRAMSAKGAPRARMVRTSGAIVW